MKTELILTPSPGRIPMFPLLARGRATKQVVRFIDTTVGMELIDREGHTSSSNNLSSWMPVTSTVWEILPPGAQIILTQE